MPYTDQAAFDVCFEWGRQGVSALADCRTFIIVDVLSFSTCVAVAAQRQVVVLPYRPLPADAAEFATSRRAILAGERGALYSLSPASLLDAPAGLRLVLPSPNGATICLDAGTYGCVLAGCLRNRSVVCRRAAVLGGPFAIIAAGERWADGSLRPGLEDLIGAGAIAAQLAGRRSPEAAAAIAAFEAVSSDVLGALEGCSSGRELVERGFRDDVRLAAELDVGTAAPELVDGGFVAAGGEA
jgi:2-phosphosulfolactate phosphatase